MKKKIIMKNNLNSRFLSINIGYFLVNFYHTVMEEKYVKK